MTKLQRLLLIILGTPVVFVVVVISYAFIATSCVAIIELINKYL